MRNFEARENLKQQPCPAALPEFSNATENPASPLQTTLPLSTTSTNKVISAYPTFFFFFHLIPSPTSNSSIMNATKLVTTPNDTNKAVQ